MPQENNMAEVVRLLHTVIGKVDGLATGLKRIETDVQGLKTNVQVLETRFDRWDAKVDRLTGRFEDVARVVIEDTQRITSLEGRVDNLESDVN